MRILRNSRLFTAGFVLLVSVLVLSASGTSYGNGDKLVGTPFLTGVAVNLEEGQFSDQVAVFNPVPAGKLFVIETVGVNAFAQPDQVVRVALRVVTGGRVGIFPIALLQVSVFPDPEFPANMLGSQLIRLYQDPNAELQVTVTRTSAKGNARVFVDISGFLVDAH